SRLRGAGSEASDDATCIGGAGRGPTAAGARAPPRASPAGRWLGVWGRAACGTAAAAVAAGGAGSGVGMGSGVGAGAVVGVSVATGLGAGAAGACGAATGAVSTRSSPSRAGAAAVAPDGSVGCVFVLRHTRAIAAAAARPAPQS